MAMEKTPFLTKTYQLVDDPSSNEMVSWNDHGNAFVVWRPDEFARDLLPKYFKHNNFSSFIRQLNTYGFRKIISDRLEFAKDYFIRGEKSLLLEIHRRKIASTSPAQAIITGIPISTSFKNSSEEVGGLSNSPTIATCTVRTDLYKENERLKEHNSSLRCELDHPRSMCCNVVAMLSNVNATQPELGVASGPMAEDETCPRLFGVSIGVKRERGSVKEQEQEQDD
ncbi:heat stress transcription factor B-2b-like [Bidens hawaiensis]|uniref:heat stress transcription factor B-2b-like n=1 Tax=Bidens hawaiensis TaxID=980011 RepID=UPI0040493310